MKRKQKIFQHQAQDLNMDNELTVILCCARIYLKTCPAQMLQQTLSHRNIDWEKLIHYAISHRLLYFISQILETHAKDMVPSSMAAKMKSLCFANSVRTLAQSAELINVFRLFEKNGIPALAFKGPTLAQMIYQTQDARIFHDLDILVPEEDAASAKNLLMDNGFHTQVKIPISQESAYLEKEHFFPLFNPTGNVSIDLHWKLSGRYGKYPVFFQDVIKSACPTMLCGHSFPTLGYEDTLIYLNIHGSSHFWENLEMLFAIAAIIQLHSHTIVWKDVLKKSEISGASKMVLLGLKLAAFFFHIPLPNSIQKKIASAKLTSLFNSVLAKIYLQQNHVLETTSWGFSPFHFLIRDNLPDALAYAGRLLFQPTIKEWQTCPLPSPRLLLLYHLIRPVRLIKEGMTAILSRKNSIHCN